VGIAEEKQAIRLAVWHALDADGISTFPRPVRGRIPNVKGAFELGRMIGLAEMPLLQALRAATIQA
jgi:hypothetical protein